MPSVDDTERSELHAAVAREQAAEAKVRAAQSLLPRLRDQGAISREAHQLLGDALADAERPQHWFPKISGRVRECVDINWPDADGIGW